MEFAPASGAGLPSAVNLCDTLTAAEKAAGTWTCLNGDGTTATGGEALSATGSISTLSLRTCPNGSDCGALSGQQHQTGEMHSSAAVASGTGSISMCWVGIPEDATGTSSLITHGTGAGTATISAYLELSSGSSAYFYISDGTTTGTGIKASAITTGARHLICGTWSSANGIIAYVDGAAGTPVARATRQSLSAPIAVHGHNTTASTIAVITQGAFVVQTELSAARIAAIARAVLADAPTGARGEALSETRASVQFCESSDGTGSLLPNNRLCVARGGTTAAQGAFTEVLLQTEALGNPAWADVATPTITSDSTVSAGGTLTADTVDDNNAAAFEGRSQTVTVTAAAAYTMSCYAKAGTLAKIRLSLDGTTGDTASLSSSSWTRVSVTDVSTSGVSVSAQVLAGTATTDTGTIIVWGCNVTPGSSLRPYIPATSASVITDAEVPYFTLTNAPALNSIEATYDQPAAITTNQRVLQLHKDANNTLAMYLDPGYSPAKLVCYWTVGGINYPGVGPSSSNSATHRGSCSYDGTNVIACVDGVCNSTAQSFTNFSGATRMYLGAYFSTGFELSPTYVLKGVKADNNSARFR